jgi:hypothetical protein
MEGLAEEGITLWSLTQERDPRRRRYRICLGIQARQNCRLGFRKR